MRTPGRLNIIVFVLAVTSVVTACAAQFQWPFGRRDSNSTTARPTATAHPAGPPVSTTAPAQPSTTGSQHPYFNQSHPALSSTVPKKENPFSAAWNKATRSVGNALTIKPKVIPAKDPTHLSNKPGTIGPDLYLSAARLMESRGQAEAAAGQYEKALSIDPKHLPSLLGLGRLYHREGRMDDAIRTCLRATQAQPQSAVAYNDLGLCYSRQSRVQSATKALSTAVELEPDSKLYRNNLAAALVQAGRNNEALMHWRQVHGTAVAHYNLGYLLYKQGKKDAASEQFKLALAQDPELRQAAQMLTRLNPERAVVRSHRLPTVIHAPPPTPAQTQPPVANQTLAPSGHPEVPPTPQPDTSPRRGTTGVTPPPGMPYRPPPAPDPRREPVVDRFPAYENSTTSPTTLAPIVRPQDYRKSPLSNGQVSPTPLLRSPRREQPQPQEQLAPIPTPQEAAVERFRNSPLPIDAETMPNRGDSQALPVLDGPVSPPGVVWPRPTPTDAPEPPGRDSRFSPGPPSAAGYEPFSPQQEPLPVFSPRPSNGPDADNEIEPANAIDDQEPAAVIDAIEPPAADHEPFAPQREPVVKYLPPQADRQDTGEAPQPVNEIKTTLPPATRYDRFPPRREPPIKYVPKPSYDQQRGDEKGPAGPIDSSEPPAFLRHRSTDQEGGWQHDHGYVRLKSQESSPTPDPRSLPDTRPTIRLPAIKMVDENEGQPAPPPLPPEQDARFGPAATPRPRELFPVR